MSKDESEGVDVSSSTDSDVLLYLQPKDLPDAMRQSPLNGAMEEACQLDGDFEKLVPFHVGCKATCNENYFPNSKRIVNGKLDFEQLNFEF